MTDIINDLAPGTMRWTISRNLVKCAAGAAITCPSCGCIMDCSRTIIMSDGTREVVLCAKCYNKSPGNIERGCVTVLDGRVLFGETPRAPRKRKAKAA